MPPDEVLCTEGKYINPLPKTQAEKTPRINANPQGEDQRQSVTVQPLLPDRQIRRIGADYGGRRRTIRAEQLPPPQKLAEIRLCQQSLRVADENPSQRRYVISSLGRKSARFK
jgi:hypothetical protein